MVKDHVPSLAMHLRLSCALLLVATVGTGGRRQWPKFARNSLQGDRP